MLLTLPSGRSIPVNYLRDETTVYAAADGSWWRALPDAGGRGSVLIRGETLAGNIRAELDDANLRDSVFERLRPTAPRFLGTLIVIELDGGEELDFEGETELVTSAGHSDRARNLNPRRKEP